MNLLPVKESTAYVLQYGGRCRDCADCLGVCPNSGLPCKPEERRQAIKWVVDAINYGVGAGYLALPSTQSGGAAK